jgi:DNA-binding CsgD family transcriptional regulator
MDLVDPITAEREADGRWIATITALPGVMAYGDSRRDAILAAQILAIRVQGAAAYALSRSTAPIDRVREQYQLTPRELEVLQLFLAGHSGKEIACRMNCSPKTVASHKAHAMRKTASGNAVELVKFGIREGLTSAEQTNA